MQPCASSASGLGTWHATAPTRRWPWRSAARLCVRAVAEATALLQELQTSAGKHRGRVAAVLSLKDSVCSRVRQAVHACAACIRVSSLCSLFKQICAVQGRRSVHEWLLCCRPVACALLRMLSAWPPVLSADAAEHGAPELLQLWPDGARRRGGALCCCWSSGSCTLLLQAPALDVTDTQHMLPAELKQALSPCWAQCTQSATDAARNERLFGNMGRPRYSSYTSFDGHGSRQALPLAYGSPTSNGWLPQGQLMPQPGRWNGGGQSALYGRVQYDY